MIMPKEKELVASAVQIIKKETGQMAVKKFKIDIEMEEEWVDVFCSMLAEMQYNGNIGRSELVALYSDGDGNFRPKFTFDIEYNKVEPKNKAILTI